MERKEGAVRRVARTGGCRRAVRVRYVGGIQGRFCRYGGRRLVAGEEGMERNQVRGEVAVARQQRYVGERLRQRDRQLQTRVRQRGPGCREDWGRRQAGR